MARRPRRSRTDPVADPFGDPHPKHTSDDAHAEIVSVKDVEPDNLKRLLSEIDGLKAKLAESEKKRSEQESAAIQAAEAQGWLIQSGIEEQPTGKFAVVKRLKEYKVVGHKDDGREILKPVFEDVRLPTFAYKIDLPPCGGNDLKINGMPLYHGATYTLDIDTLRSVKDIVARCWKHDADIHGSDENFYRQKKQNRLSARGMA